MTTSPEELERFREQVLIRGSSWPAVLTRGESGSDANSAYMRLRALNAMQRTVEAASEAAPALEAYPDDPGLAALSLVTLAQSDKKRDFVLQLNSIVISHPGLAGPRIWLAGLLLRAQRRDQVDSILAELGDAPSPFKERASARLAFRRKDFPETLRQIQALRAEGYPLSGGDLRLELWAKKNTGDRVGTVAAHAAIGDLFSFRARPWLFAIWHRGRVFRWLSVACVAVGGVLGWWPLGILGLLIAALYPFAIWHVLRSRAFIRKSLVIPLDVAVLYGLALLTRVLLMKS
ncbi:MAG: hypothetical protein HY240_01570 [Actinobacteria bacterium]|nr:hypothetical protein [Actinomycetota bacterium]